MNELVKNGQYEFLVEEIKATITESVFNSRRALIDGHYLIGKAIREYAKENITNLLQDLAGDVGLAERTLWYSVKLYDKYPDLGQLPEGKNISWNKLITKYLPDNPKAPKEEKLIICPKCGFSFSRGGNL